MKHQLNSMGAVAVLLVILLVTVLACQSNSTALGRYKKTIPDSDGVFRQSQDQVEFFFFDQDLYDSQVDRERELFLFTEIPGYFGDQVLYEEE